MVTGSEEKEADAKAAAPSSAATPTTSAASAAAPSHQMTDVHFTPQTMQAVAAEAKAITKCWGYNAYLSIIIFAV